MRTPLVVLAAALLALPLGAQAPKGFLMRVDRSTAASDPDAPGDVKIAAMGSGFHIMAPKAAVFWSPDSTAKGTYTLAGTFHLMEPSGHANYYGLILGGSDLAGPKQDYLYFMVAQNGTWLIKHRAGDSTTHNVTPRTPSDAVKKPTGTGSVANVLEVRVGPESLVFVVNGTVVHTIAKADMKSPTDGIFGVRVNHMLNVHVEKFGVVRK